MTDIGRTLARLEKRLAAVERTARLSSASLDNTALEVRDGSGSLRALVGQQGDGTTAVNVVNGPPPPQPSAPIVASVLGGITISWDGTFADGAVMPLDWARVEVHASPLAAYEPTAATLRSTIETAQGATVVVSCNGPVYVRLLARSTSGTASTGSATVGPFGPGPVVATDILDGIVTTVKLADDAVTAAKVATGAIGTTEITDNAITTPKIVAGAVQAAQIDAEAVNASKIAAGAVTTAKLDALAVTADKIAANAITVGKLAAGSVDAAALKADAITGKNITGGTVTGATLQTSNAGQRVKVIPSNSAGIPAVQLYSGASTETTPGELVASVINAGHPRPYAALWAPTVGAPDTSATLQLTSGGGTDTDQGEWQISTGDGSGGETRIYAYAADGGPNPGQITATIYNPAGGGTTAELNIYSDVLEWVDGNSKGFTYNSNPGLGAVGLSFAGSVSATETAWTTYTPTVTGGGSATYSSRTGWYYKLGKAVHFCAQFAVSADGSGATPITITAPSSIYRGTRQVFSCHAQGIYVSGLVANGSALALDTGSGATIDRISVSNNSATNRDNILNGGQLLNGATVTIQGWYREA